MCTASSVRQWGLSVKEKYGNFFESPGKDPRVEWAACCDSEVPLSGGAGAEAGLKDAVGSSPAVGGTLHVLGCSPFITARGFDADMFTTHSWTILANTARLSELQLCLSNQDYRILFHNKGKFSS